MKKGITLSLNELKDKYKLASKDGVLLTNSGYKKMKETGELLHSEIKEKNLSKDKRAWFAGYSSGITEVQVRYAKKGLFSKIKRVFSGKKRDITLEDWQEEGFSDVMNTFKEKKVN